MPGTLTIMSRPATRFRWAQVGQDEAGLDIVRLNSPELVLPRGVNLTGPQPDVDVAMLDTTPRDALVSLMALDGYEDMPSAAQALKEHCETHPAGGLLCREHGLPVGHILGNGPWPGCDAGYELRVDHVLTMVRSLRAVEAMAFHATHRRTPLKKVQLDDVMQWPILDPEVGFWNQSKQLTTTQQRNLIKDYLSALQWQAGTGFFYDWIDQLGLRLTFSTWTLGQASNHVRTDLGFYVAAFVDVALDAVNVSGVRRSVRCQACGQPFQPRNSRQVFCSRPDCQREHRRINKARARARLSASESEGESL